MKGTARFLQVHLSADVEDRLEAMRRGVAELRMAHKQRTSTRGVSISGDSGGAGRNEGSSAGGLTRHEDAAPADQVSGEQQGHVDAV